MRNLFAILLAVSCLLSARAAGYDYSFTDVPLSEAIVKISREHPEINISFIYKEMDHYTCTAKIDTDDPAEALRRVVGNNPVTIIRRGKHFYIEALQQGLFRYTGRAIDSADEPVVGATVMLLSPTDSTVITFGITDRQGYFSIPCDRRGVVGKATCLGFMPLVRAFDNFKVGTLVMKDKPELLGEVKIEGVNAHLYADKSVYLPSARQKRASQNGVDLLSNMAIPQLSVSSGKIKTASGRPVAVFIDYIPAQGSDLNAMRVADVKRVEFLEYPSDPRLQGNAFVVNFIMQQYEYGGYVKTMGHTNLVSNGVADGLANVRLKYKRVTYDLMGSAYYYDRSHMGSDLTETFRLPQPDGDVKEFTRRSQMLASKEQQTWYYSTFRATYSSDKVQAQSQIIGKIDRKPDTQRSGSVTYSPAEFPDGQYSSLSSDCSKFIAYNGYYFFILPKSNSLVFSPSYSFSHTAQNSTYNETDYNPIINGATDNTNKLSGKLKFQHDFGKYGTLTGLLTGSYEYNRTRYTGTAVALDRAKSSRLGAGVNYSVTVKDFYGHIGFGWDWDRLQFGSETDRPSAPNFNISLRYAFNPRHSLSAAFSYESWLPSPGYKSDKIIEASPLLSYTGNPNLVPAKSYDFDFDYTFIPNNNYSVAAYAWGWFVGNRYVYDYEATSSSVLRTIKQPMGSYAQGVYGLSAALRFLDRSLVVSGNVGHLLNHNGAPYSVNHSRLNWHARLRYYLGDWNFTFTYVSPTGSADGCMNGIWVTNKSSWYITVGWANDKWNLRGDLINFTRWHWNNSVASMQSPNYDTRQTTISGSSRAFIQLSATYTLGFGKKVERTDQPAVSGAASSGILK